MEEKRKHRKILWDPFSSGINIVENLSNKTPYINSNLFNIVII